jgi:hypothetical protein
MRLFSSTPHQSTLRRLGLGLILCGDGGCAVGVEAPPQPGSPAAQAVAGLPAVIAASEAAARHAADAEGVAARLRAGELTEAEAQAELERLTAAAEVELGRAREALEAAKAPLRTAGPAVGATRP